MTPARIIVDKVAQSDITIAQWIRSLPNYALARIALDAPDHQIRSLAMQERHARLWLAVESPPPPS
jgi:hypothetical protein